MSLNGVKTKIKSAFSNKRQIYRFLFWFSIIILPLIQFCVFYIYVNLNMFKLAFQKYEPYLDRNGYSVTFVFLDNFKIAWKYIIDSKFMIKNSLIKYLFCTLISMCLSIIFSFYLYKKYFAHSTFKVILFMPQIISGVVFALLFTYLVNDVYKEIVFKLNGKIIKYGLLDDPKKKLGTVIFFNIWVSFGVNIMLFSGAMNGINESIVESSKLDGASIIQEFFYITLPMIFSTIKSLLVLGLVGIFTDQMHLYTLYYESAGETSTLGYSIYLQSLNSDIVNRNKSMLNYSQLSALGIILTFITLPVTLIIKKLLDKFGPSEV